MRLLIEMYQFLAITTFTIVAVSAVLFGIISFLYYLKDLTWDFREYRKEKKVRSTELRSNGGVDEEK